LPAHLVTAGGSDQEVILEVIGSADRLPFILLPLALARFFFGAGAGGGAPRLRCACAISFVSVQTHKVPKE